MTYFLSNSDFKVIPPGNTNLRFCMKDLISNSNYDICQSYNNPILVFDSFKLYKNYFCLDSNVSSDMYSFVCIYKIVDMLLQDSLVFSLSILVSLGNPTGAYTNENKCREWTEEVRELIQFVPVCRNYCFDLKFICTLCLKNSIWYIKSCFVNVHRRSTYLI